MTNADAGRTETVEIMESSGNVFADLGLPNPEESLLKSELSLAIRHLIEERHLTQKEAAYLLDTEQPRISDILRGRVRGFSVERLLSYVAALDCDVRIQIVPRAKSAQRTGSSQPKRGRIYAQLV